MIMKWLRVIVLTIAVGGAITIPTNLTFNETAELEQSPIDIQPNIPYENTVEKLRHMIKTHTLFHEKIKVTLNNLISETELYIKKKDADGLKETTADLLDLYGASIADAAKAFEANDIKGANIFLSEASNMLENLYNVQEILLMLKRGLTPTTTNKSGIIKSASIPKGSIALGDFLKKCVQ